MPRRKVPITFTYQKNGTNPPIYVAGSFSNPPWQPQEMDVSIDQHGGHLFTKQVMVDDGSEIQYKFRIGPGDWWALDESADTVSDGCGNTNNVLRVSLNGPREANAKVPNPRVNELKGSTTDNDTQTADMAKTAAEVADSARIIDSETPELEISDDDAGRLGVRRLSHTPINQVAQTAMEVAATAATLDENDWISDDETDAEDGDPPAFSHEFMGQVSDTHNRRESKTGSDMDDPDIEIQHLDFNDPTLEAFPSNNRESILAAVRRISTSINADRTVIGGIPPPPAVSIFQQPSSTDNSSKDKSNLRSDEITKQYSIQHSPRPPSTSSLLSIAEDDEFRIDNADDKLEQNSTPFVQHPGPWGSAPERDASVDSNDEGIAMKIETKRAAMKSQDCSPLDSVPATPGGSVSEIAESNSNEIPPALKDDADTPAEGDVNTSKKDATKDSPTITVRHTPGTYASDSSNMESTSDEGGKSTLSSPNNETDVGKRAADGSVTSPTHFQTPNQTSDWLDICLRVVFVRWIGGLVGWLYGRRNRTLMAAGTAILVLGVGVLWQNPIRL
ncbi:hypothetical protein F4804DRAFT_342938 [Jackrogersella minutella]|nr:hypothetical protein F4804DRAFT_342938 [Jackrogersella minutella]